MSTLFFRTGSIKGGIALDGRTKLLLLFWGVLLSALLPGGWYETVLCFSVLLLTSVCGLFRFSVKMAFFYGLVLLVQYGVEQYAGTAFAVFFVSFFMMIRKLLPTVALGALLVLTTRVNEFMFSMEWFRLPRTLTIAFAVMLRYFPCVREDFLAIRDAMRLRGLKLSLPGILRSPLLHVECLYVPALFSASRLADELSAASSVRGIEHPGRRTCLSVNGFHLPDSLALLLFTGLSLLLALPLL